MKKIHRDRVDIGVSFASRAKRVTTLSHLEGLSPIPFSESGGSEIPRKKNFYRPHRLLYGLFKSIIRPFASRLREYITAPIRQDLHNISKFKEEVISQLYTIRQNVDLTARRFALPCNTGEVLIKTNVGYVLCTASDYAVIICLIEGGEFERGTRLLIQRFLNPGDTFVDIGAHLGLHTLAAAHSMKGVGKIIAFEPFETTKRLLEKSIWMNGFSNVTEVHHAAVSNKTGCQKLFMGPASSQHSLFPLDNPSGFSTEAVEVSVVKLEDVISLNQKVDLIKIDAEGAELEILESAGSLINANSNLALIVEFGPSHLKRTGHSPREWLGAFAKVGLQYKVINSDTGVLEDWSLSQLENTYSVNLFFAQKNSNAWERVIQ